MADWGRRKDGRPYKKTGSSKTHKSGSTKSAGTKLKTKKSPRYSKGQQLIFNKLKNANSKTVLEKSEVQSIANALNGSSGGESSRNFGAAANNLLWNYQDMHDGVSITNAHNEQGYNWLKKKAQKDRMGNKEKKMFNNFKEFKLIGFKNESWNQQTTNYVPVWDVYNKEGFVFQYYMANGSKLLISG